jgi:nucleotide-binding universal stress UspA family protein
VGELLRHPPHLYWLVSGIMEHPTIGQIFGDPSSGKSFVALDIAASVATGTSWHGHTVTKGPVVYVAGEGYAGVLRRLKAWEIDRELPLEGIPLHVSSGAVEFSSPETVKRLWDELDALEQPVLIVIDTLARAATGWDENSTKDMGMFMSAIEQLARRYDCSVLLVHHTGHGNSDRGRGASSIPAALDMSMRLENKQGVRRLDCTKMKDSEEFPSEHFDLRPVKLPPDWLDSDGERIVSAVLVESSRGAQAVVEKPRGTNQVAVFKVASDMQWESPEGDSGEPPQLSFADWKRRCANQGIERNRFAEAHEGLITKGLITMDGERFKIASPLFPEALRE